MGGWFGDLIKLKPLWFNPLDDPMRMPMYVLSRVYSDLFDGVRAYQILRQ